MTARLSKDSATAPEVVVALLAGAWSVDVPEDGALAVVLEGGGAGLLAAFSLNMAAV
jgi:hypothetical protein